jgi:hypothetical protein
MTKHVGAVGRILGAGLFLFPLGCGGKAPQGQPQDLSKTARMKVEAFKRIADEVAKNPNSVAVAGALEEYTMVPFDAQNSPKEAEEILEIYRQRIEGKSGKYSQEIKNAIAAVQSGLKRAKEKG